MGIREYLINDLDATHLFMLDKSSSDGGSSPYTLGLSLGTGAKYSSTPICEGVSKCLLSTDNNNSETIMDGSADINTSPNYKERSMILWTKLPDFVDPTCIYEQGGGTNNFAIIAGLGGVITIQAADAGQPFLIVGGKDKLVPNRAYFVTHIWQHRDRHSGSHNRLELHINGVFQGELELTGTDAFPGHSGDIAIGNTSETLQSYNGTVQKYMGLAKRCNMLGFFNERDLSVSQSRNIFERSVKPEHYIPAVTRQEQQNMLDALSGSRFKDVNCAIRIAQASDEAGDYSLFIDDIKFWQNPNLGDIAVQYVGPNTLTLINVNGSDTYVTSTPDEVELVGETLIGGGNVVIDGSGSMYLRQTEIEDMVDLKAVRMYFSDHGSVDMEGCMFDELINVSEGTVDIDVTASSVGTNIGDISTTTEVKATISYDRGIKDIVWAMWPAEDGLEDRRRIQATDNKKSLRADSGVDYYFVCDGINAHRSEPVIFTAGEGDIISTLVRIKHVDENILPTRLTWSQEYIADMVHFNVVTGAIEFRLPDDYVLDFRWNSDYQIWTFIEEDFRAIAYKADLLQSTKEMLFSVTTLNIRNFEFIFAPSSPLRLMQHPDNPDCKINMSAWTTRREGDEQQLKTHIDHTNGIIETSAEAPVIATFPVEAKVNANVVAIGEEEVNGIDDLNFYEGFIQTMEKLLEIKELSEELKISEEEFNDETRHTLNTIAVALSDEINNVTSILRKGKKSGVTATF